MSPILPTESASARPATARTGAGLRLFCMLAVLLPSPLLAEVALSPNHPQSYTVRAGDTLWSIAGRFLRDPWRWRDVWQANPGITNPNRIYPGDVLELTYDAAGNPRIRKGRGGLRVVKLSPRVRVEEVQREVPTIPINVVAPFLSRPFVADSRELDKAPYVVGFPEGHILAAVGDIFFVRSIYDAADDRFEILRPGQEYRDPDTGEVLGYEASYVAEARLERTGDPATLFVIRSDREVEIGDRARPTRENRPIRSFLPHPAPPGLEGKIIAVLGGVSQIGQYDVVVLNRGQRDGAEIGQVFEVFRGGNERRDPVRAGRDDWNWRNETPLNTSFWYGDWEPSGWVRDKPDPNAPLPLHRKVTRQSETYIVPDSRAGVVMIFRVFPRVSFALVMYAREAMQIGEVVSPPRDG